MPVFKAAEAKGIQGPKPFRPSKEFLDIFWTLAEGSDEQRTKGTIKLSQLIKDTQNEKEKTVAYCRDRLVKGLSSGRKFARIGFSVTLSELLRRKYFQPSDVLAAIRDKLKIQHHEKSSKSELGGIYLGRAFGFSSIVQSNTLTEIGGEVLSRMVDEIISMASKKSYLRAICNKLLEDIVSQVSSEDFEEYVWPKLKDKMKQGWDNFSVDLLSLLLACRAKFPDVVKKKFLKKHWGHPVLSEENDEKLLRATMDSIQRREILLEKIIPLALADGRDVTSLWKGIGEKLSRQEPEKKSVATAARHLLGLQLASTLLERASKQEVLDLTLSPALACHIFHAITHRDDPVAKEADVLFERLVSHLKTREKVDENQILNIMETLWRLDAELIGKLKPSKGGPRIDLINSANFTHLFDLMTVEESESYVNILISMIKGKDQWKILSDYPPRRTHQIETCLRHLQHLVTMTVTGSSHQTTILTLMLRLAYFKVDKKVKAMKHCEACVNFQEDDTSRKLCESLLFKSLNTISTQNTSHQKRSERDSNFIELLHNICQYMQELLSTEQVQTIKEWPDELKSEWNKVYTSVTKIKKNESSTQITQAFLLLFQYLGLQMLVDFKTVSEILQDVFICFEKATSAKKLKKQDPEDPPWIEVLTEILLQLMSLPSHLGRVITATVFRMLTNHMTPKAVGLITEVLIPKKTRGDDAGGAMVEADQEDEEGDDEEEDDMEEDSSSDDENEEAENGEEKEDEDEEMDDEEEDNIEVDDGFRESVKQALGQAADEGDSDDEEQELSDLSDSEMFKLDDMLAEVFRQRRKAGSGKKARAEKQAELANFRLRVLDLVENMIKSDRCGDFLLDIIKPLLILTLRSQSSESQALSGRAKALFTQLRTKSKGLKDKIHTKEEHRNFFLELLELAKKTSDPSHLQTVSIAVYIVMNITYEDKGAIGASACIELFQETLTGIISKKQSKPHFTFFTSIIEMNPLLFQSLSGVLLSNLQDDSTKVYNKTLCCSVLASLCKKIDNSESDRQSKMQWMRQAANIASQIICATTRESIKSLLLKEVLQLVLSLQARNDCLEENAFDSALKEKLTKLKPKFNTDLKRLANKVIAGIDRSRKQDGGKNKKKKRKLSNSENDVPQSKKVKHKE